MPVIRHAVDGRVFAHRRDDDSVAQRQIAERRVYRKDPWDCPESGATRWRSAAAFPTQAVHSRFMGESPDAPRFTAFYDQSVGRLANRHVTHVDQHSSRCCSARRSRTRPTAMSTLRSATRGQVTITRPPGAPTAPAPTGDAIALADGSYLWSMSNDDSSLWIGHTLRSGSPDISFGDDGTGRVTLADCTDFAPTFLVPDGGRAARSHGPVRASCMCSPTARSTTVSVACRSSATTISSSRSARDDSGRFVFAATMGRTFDVFRFEADGVAPDQAFGTAGHVRIAIAGVNDLRGINAIAVRADGRILATGLARQFERTESRRRGADRIGRYRPRLERRRDRRSRSTGRSVRNRCDDRRARCRRQPRRRRLREHAGAPAAVCCSRVSIRPARSCPRSGCASTISSTSDSARFSKAATGSRFGTTGRSCSRRPRFRSRSSIARSSRCCAPIRTACSIHRSATAAGCGYTIADPDDAGQSGDYDQLHAVASRDDSVLVFGRTFFEDDSNGRDYVSMVRTVFAAPDALFADGFDTVRRER